jgi:protoheme IX farnesyltransferase
MSPLLDDAADRAAAAAAPPVAKRSGLSWGAYVSLVRPRIMALVLTSMTATAMAAVDGPIDALALAHALLGTALVIAGAVALNQRYEVSGDAKMPRTWARPLPAGRISPRRAGIFGVACSLGGLGYLALASGAAVAALAVLSWLLYVAAYTPLKSRTVWQTPVGAVAGAMPVLLGAAAVEALASPVAWSLFGVLFLWQLPHAMAIAWLFRHEFAAAEVRVAPVVDPSGRTAGWLAAIGAIALTPLSMLPVLTTGWPYAASAAALGAALAVVAIAFAVDRTEPRARLLLHASLVYLPAVLTLILLGRYFPLA